MTESFISANRSRYMQHLGWFFAEGEWLIVLLAMPPTSQEGGVRDVAWLIQATA